MEDDVRTARKLFGEMAVQKGYCTKEDVDRALEIQRALEASGEPRTMLGLIMLEETMINNQQFIELLMELDHLVHEDEPEGYDVPLDIEEEAEEEELDDMIGEDELEDEFEDIL